MKCGLKQSKEDSCLFFAREENKFMFCATHVDNMTVISREIERFLDKVKQYVDVKDF